MVEGKDNYAVMAHEQLCFLAYMSYTSIKQGYLIGNGSVLHPPLCGLWDDIPLS